MSSSVAVGRAGDREVIVSGGYDTTVRIWDVARTQGEISDGHRHLVIDLTAATFLDCASVATLLRAVAPLRHEPDAAIVLAGATGIVKRLLDLLQQLGVQLRLALLAPCLRQLGDLRLDDAGEGLPFDRAVATEQAAIGDIVPLRDQVGGKRQQRYEEQQDEVEP